MSASNAQRLTDIGKLIADIIQPAFGQHSLAVEAKKASDDETDRRDPLRLPMLEALAAFSVANDLSAADIATGAMLAAKSCTNEPKLPKSLDTFVGEIEVVMDPKVRGIVPDLFAAAAGAWDAEAAELSLDKTRPAPIKKTFIRRYHMMVRVARIALKEGVILDSGEKVREYAITNDPDLNPTKQAEAIKKIVAQLTVIYGNFRDDDLGSAIDTLVLVNKETLQALHEQRVMGANTHEDIEGAEKKADAVAEVTPTVVVVEPAAGAVDVDIDDLIGGPSLATSDVSSDDEASIEAEVRQEELV